MEAQYRTPFRRILEFSGACLARGPVRFVLALVGGLVAVVALTVAIAVGDLLARLGPSSLPAVLQGPQHDLRYRPDDFWPEEGRVLHLVSPERSDANGHRYVAHYWFDPRRGRAFVLQFAADGPPEAGAGVDGGLYWTFGRGGGFRLVKEEPVEAWNSWLVEHGDPIVTRQIALRGRNARTEVMVEGRPALRIEVPRLGEGSDVKAVSYLYVDPESKVPLGYGHRWLAPEEVDASLFSPPREFGTAITRWERDESLTLEEARTIADFPVYWAGPEVAGLRLQALRRFQRGGPAVAVPVDRVEAAYVRPGGGGLPDVYVSSSPDTLVAAPWEEDPPMPRPGAPGRWVDLGWGQGLLFEAPGDATLWIAAGPTVVMVSAPSAARAVEVGKALRRLD